MQQLDGGQHKERRGVEEPKRRWTTHQEEGSRGPNKVADDTTVNDGKVTVAKMAFNGSSGPPVCRHARMQRTIKGW